MRSIIIIDFDKTLFDADAFRRALEGVFARHGISAEDFYATYNMRAAHRPQWTLEHQLKLLGEKYKQIDAHRLRRSIDLLCLTSERFVYGDTLAFLAALKSAGHQLHLLSFGDNRFQTEKVRGCGIAKYFSSIRVTPHQDKSQELHHYLSKSSQHPQQNAIFIDDHKDILRSVKMRYPQMVTILMSRSGMSRSAIGSCAGNGKVCFTGIDYEVSSLAQTQKIIDTKTSDYPWILSLWQKIMKKT